MLDHIDNLLRIADQSHRQDQRRVASAPGGALYAAGSSTGEQDLAAPRAAGVKLPPMETVE